MELLERSSRRKLEVPTSVSYSCTGSPGAYCGVILSHLTCAWKGLLTRRICSTLIQPCSYLLHYQRHAKLRWKLQWGMRAGSFSSLLVCSRFCWLGSTQPSHQTAAWSALTLIDWPNYPIVLSLLLLQARGLVMRWVTGWRLAGWTADQTWGDCRR